MAIKTRFLEQDHIATIEIPDNKGKFVLLKNSLYGVSIPIEEIPNLIEALNQVYLKGQNVPL